MVTALVSQEEKNIVDEIKPMLISFAAKAVEDAIKIANKFAQLSYEGVRYAKRELKGIVSGSTIDKIVAIGKTDYPKFMLFTAGISPSTWRILDPEARKVAMNENATVAIRILGRASPVIKTVGSLTGAELSQVFRKGFKGAVPPDKQYPVPPETKRDKKDANCQGFEEFEAAVASGTEYVLVSGKMGAKIKIPMKVLKNIIK